MTRALIFLISYILGSIPSGYIVVKLFTGKNIMENGTGNVGTMNTHRTTNNKYLTILVLLSDLAKGYASYFIAVLLAVNFILPPIICLSIAGFALILGHNYSIFLKFKGGKGLAAAAGFTLGFNPLFVLVWILIFLLVVLITKYMVLGQMLASLFIPIFAFFIDYNHFLIIAPLCLLVIIKHAPRMKNVLDGSEPKMYYKIKT